MKKKGKSSICGKELLKSDLLPNGEVDCINGAVIGECIEIIGHPTCIHNVDRIVVLENRFRLYPLLEKLGA